MFGFGGPDKLQKLMEAGLATAKILHEEKTKYPNGRTIMAWGTQDGGKRCQIAIGLWRPGFELHVLHPEYNKMSPFTIADGLSWEQALSMYDQYVEMVKGDTLPNEITAASMSPLHTLILKKDPKFNVVRKGNVTSILEAGSKLLDTMFAELKVKKADDSWPF